MSWLMNSSRSTVHYLVSAVASLLAIVSTQVHADTVDNADLQAWLYNSSGLQGNESNSIIYGAASISDLNNLAYAIVNPDSELSTLNTGKDRFGKTREKKLLRKIRDQLKINLYRSESKDGSHRIYLNALKRELVGQSRVGNMRYEIRVSEKEASARFRYRF